MFRLALILFLVFSVNGSAEHVAVVAPKAFHRSLEPWIRHRSSQGYTVHVLVEPFGDNATTPEKIKQRIRSLSEQVSLGSVLLIGEGVDRSDHPDRVLPSPRFPTRVIQRFGTEDHLAVDDWFVDLDEDGRPDVPIGRMPVATPEQLDALIRKTIRYETECKADLWCRRLRVVAGVGNFSPLIDGVIESAARYALTEIVPSSWEVSLLHANWQSPFCPSGVDFQRELVESIDQSPLFWVYLGHGHHRMLQPLATPYGKYTTLHADRKPEFHCRDSYPIALLFCCYGGAPDAVTPSLAEEMIRQTEGPVAAVAASRTAMPYGMSVLGIEMLEELLRKQQESEERLTLGRLLFEGKRRMLNPELKKPESERLRGPRRRPLRKNLETMAKMLDPDPGRLDVQLEEHAALFHLFGDPLLALPVPKTLQVECAPKVEPGGSLTIRGKSTEKSGTVSIELTLPPSRLSLTSPRRTGEFSDGETRQADNDEYRRSNDPVVRRAEALLSDGNFVAEIPVPEDVRGEYVVRVFATFPDGYALGAATVRIGSR